MKARQVCQPHPVISEVGTAESAEKLTVETRDQASTLTTSTNASLALDGKSTYVTVPNSPGLNVTGPLTVDAWIKTTSNTPQGIVSHHSRGGGFALQLTPRGKLEFLTISDNQQKAHVTGRSTVSTNEWHHVAGVFDGSELRVFLDGVLDGLNPSGAAPATTTADLKIGTSGDSGGRFFSGLIDDVRVTAGIRYAANFTPEPRLTIGGLVLGPDGSGVRGLWSFDDQTTSDSSGYNNNASLIGAASFPTVVPGERATMQPTLAAPAAPPAATTVSINFDDVASGTNVETRYLNQNVRLSSEPGFGVFTFHSFSGNNAPRSQPNAIAAGRTTFPFAYDFFRNMQFDFPQPVSDLRFYVTSCDDYFVIAWMDVYYDGTKTRTFTIAGGGPTHPPLLQDFQPLGLNNITRVVVYGVRDYLGLDYDDLSFTYTPPTPSPTPTPTPIPPPTPLATPYPPTNLFAEANKLKVSMMWDAASGGSSYNVKRRTSFDSLWTTIASAVLSTSYIDSDAIPDTLYFYKVTAVNSDGESFDSNVVSATLVPSCGEGRAQARAGVFSRSWRWLELSGHGER